MKYLPSFRCFARITTVIACLVGASSLTRAADFTASLYGYWALDEASGTNVTDLSGTHPDGIVLQSDGLTPRGLGGDGSVWVNDPERGTVVGLTGNGADAYVLLGTNTIPIMDLANNFTWAFWAKSDQNFNNDGILGNRFNPEGQEWSPREFIKFTGNQFEWHWNAVGDNLDYDNFNIQTDWMHHVVVKEGSSLTYYRDGVFAGSHTISGTPNNPQPLYISVPQEAWRGYIEETALWTRALSSDDVNLLHHLGAGGGSIADTMTPGPAHISGRKPGVDATGVAFDTPIVVSIVEGTTTVVDNTVQITVNGEIVAHTVSSRVQITPQITRLDLTVPAPVLPDYYASGEQVTVNVKFTDSASAQTDETWSFTVREYFTAFDPANYTFEAEDFNFEGGMFFDNPDLCNTIGGGPNCYFDRVGTQDIDKLELDRVITTTSDLNVYRFGSALVREEFMDTRTSSDPLTRTQYVAAGVSEYELRLGTGEWVNYTRTFPAGNYNLYARVPATAGIIPVQVDLVDNATVSNQNLTTVGYMVLDGSGTAGEYEMVPVTDYSGGTPAVLSFDGTPKTLRMTAMANGYVANFYMLEATTNAPTQMPQVTITSPEAGAVLTNETTITATATSGGGSITNVQFFARDVLIGEDNEGPDYSTTFTPSAPEGDLAIRVLARDDSGLTGAHEIIVSYADPAFVKVGTSDGNGADNQITEQAPAENRGGNGEIVVRRNSNNSNHSLVVLRFDVSGIDLSQIGDATLNLYCARGSYSQWPVYLVGIPADATNANHTHTPFTYLESELTYSNMPGMLPPDPVSTTHLLTFDWDWNQVSIFATNYFNATPAAPLMAIGEGLTEYLRSQAGQSNVVIAIEHGDPNGNLLGRLTSKEATSVRDSNPPLTGAAGDFEPFLKFRPVALPEPIEITGFSLSGDQLTLEWTGGTGPFTVEKKTLITDAWADEQTGIAGNSATVTISLDGGGSGYYQIVGQ